MNNEDKSLFFADFEITDNISFLNQFKDYVNKKQNQVYILSKPLSLPEAPYVNTNYKVVLSPKCKIVFINLGQDSDDFEYFVEDFINDIIFLVKKYEYTKILGNVRKSFFDNISFTAKIEAQEICNLFEEVAPNNFRKIDMIISLLVGSINDINRIKENTPSTTLEKIKQNIIIYDGIQSDFIYKTPPTKKEITIQGLAGTGKTELLLHKLRELYTTHRQSRIIFTCYNVVLANDMKERVKKFFNFMKVEEQIDWENRLFVFHSWGSAGKKHSGLISYICDFYKIDFLTYRECPDFTSYCKKILNALNLLDSFTPCIDYVLIDESQDFEEEFFELCKKITSNQVYIAGDIFQNIFDTKALDIIQPDFLLNKCYRTEPKTLMFAHAVGMGLYEQIPIQWLENQGWYNCGYQISENEQNITLSRKPIKRFEDINVTSTVKIIASNDNIVTDIINSIKDIIKEFSDVTPDDIGIVIIDKIRKFSEISFALSTIIEEEFKWATTNGYECKQRLKDSVYISNQNNIKGLEFPFVICVAPNIISKIPKIRNAIYMTLTRSFLTSYFIVSNKNNENKDFIDIYSNAINDIDKTGEINIRKPSLEEIERIKLNIKQSSYEYDNIPLYIYNKAKENFEEIIISDSDKEFIFKKIKEFLLINKDIDKIIEQIIVIMSQL